MRLFPLYLHYARLSLRSQMQNRASFYLLVVGHFLTTAIEFLGIAALFYRFGQFRGWLLPEIALFYGMIHIAFAFAEGMGRGFDEFGKTLRSGDFDRFLTRPLPTAFQVAAGDIQAMRVGRLIQGGAVFCWAVANLAIIWTPLKIALILFMLLGGFCLFLGLLIVQATLAFWTVESLEVMNIFTYGGVEAGQYPLTIYSPWLRGIFTYVVPIACINYLPMSLILGRDVGVSAAVRFCSPLAGVAFLWVALQIWRFGERRYSSTGS